MPTAIAAATTVRVGVPTPWLRLACAQCRRSLSASPAVASGHNRWSKIRHDKGAADAKKTALRSSFTKALTMYSQLYGGDVDTNPRLAATVTAAKKAGVPKAIIEGAVARGQGRSADGARLESATYEIMMPPGVAVIVDLETTSKLRAMQDLNALVRRRGGSATPTKFFFTRRGRVVLGGTAAAAETEDERGSAGSAGSAGVRAVAADDILDDAIEAGAEDVETDEASGRIVVWTPPLQTAAVVDRVAPKFGLAVRSADTVWAANGATLAPVGQGDDLRKLAELVASLRSHPEVRAIYANAVQGDAPDEAWQQIAGELDW
ncbi:DUF28 domain containing protein [Niveomyces insectorum RCEF 264]|uniref:DUF28 domain containing protein n=1 Tax=Niveomyces insectorum RCEF 264 TaxID=1081102 RepID=A0A167LDC1_9HYPO|nr:DUF28 domain containing protein [Niveomyces insectorum RCEF 264]